MLLPLLPRRGRVLSGPEASPRFFGVPLQFLSASAHLSREERHYLFQEDIHSAFDLVTITIF